MGGGVEGGEGWKGGVEGVGVEGGDKPHVVKPALWLTEVGK